MREEATPQRSIYPRATGFPMVSPNIERFLSAPRSSVNHGFPTRCFPDFYSGLSLLCEGGHTTK